MHENSLKYANLYFSRDGEDAALQSVFKRRIHDQRPGVYVDIGCLHPMASSNTYFFTALVGQESPLISIRFTPPNGLSTVNTIHLFAQPLAQEKSLECTNTSLMAA